MTKKTTRRRRQDGVGFLSFGTATQRGKPQKATESVAYSRVNIASVAQAPSIQLFDAGIEFVIAAAHGEQLFVGAFFDDLALF